MNSLSAQLLINRCTEFRQTLQIFDHIAESLEQFLREENITAAAPLPTGFSFSFPSDQKSLKHSILLTWTKSFKCPDGPGLDACVLLEEAIARRKGLVQMPVLWNIWKTITNSYPLIQVQTRFEKSFGGLYLGEQVRLTLLKLIDGGCLFNGKSSPELMKRWGFTTSNVTSIEADNETSERTWSVLQAFGLADRATEEDVSLVREVCAIVSERGSKIVAAALAVLLNHIHLPEVTIAFDGSLFEKHPKYRVHIADLLAKQVPTTKTKLILVKDGSGQGAAFVAAVEYKQP